MSNRQRIFELVAHRKKALRTRILKRLFTSTAHRSLSVNEIVTLADKLVGEAFSFDQPGYNNGTEAASAAKSAQPDASELVSPRFQYAMLEDSNEG